jgi:dihydroneopterin aldolase
MKGYSDEQAHRLAILAMHRMARDMTDMQPRLTMAAGVQDMRDGWKRGAIPVWLPLRLAERDGSIPHDWTVTSDGLAARLSERLGGLPLLLLKSCRVRRSVPALVLAAAGVVDPTFAAIVRRAGLKWRILGPQERREFRQLIEA